MKGFHVRKETNGDPSQLITLFSFEENIIWTDKLWHGQKESVIKGYLILPQGFVSSREALCATSRPNIFVRF